MRIEVSGDDLVALGESMGHVAADLAWCADSAASRAWALGPGRSRGALAAVLGDFEHQRLLLGRRLDDLASGLRRAGAAYVDVEQDAASLFAGSGDAP
ncbi:hypothetical protein [Pedococcus ginsenosidimutans]|jgi:hypothetical protein|uniref:hypothetical protein n=1 Tax=Pedococcus ginsenosidimutans TaxID=490570 RepID=UPI0031EC3C3E